MRPYLFLDRNWEPILILNGRGAGIIDAISTKMTNEVWVFILRQIAVIPFFINIEDSGI